MKYQLVDKFSNNAPLVITFFEDQPPEEQSHIQQFGLQSYFEQALTPQKANCGMWLQSNQKSWLLYNIGKRKKFTANSIQSTVDGILKQLSGIKATEATLGLPLLADEKINTEKQTVLAIEKNHYEFKITQKERKPAPLHSINLLMAGEQNTIAEAQHLAAGMALTQDLANCPPNICTPTYVAEQAETLAKTDPLFKLKVMGEHDMNEMGMNAILSVSQGSDQEAKLVELQYQNGGAQAPIVLVGKGVTFDSGGLSLKPPASMYEMKYDMCGAASVLGTLKAISLLKLPLNVIGLLSCSENLPGPSATKPGTVIHSHSKKTIEILNTDAEGRLVLCDALSYAEQFKPAKVIDIATLTGAAIVALGYKAHCILANDQDLCDALLDAGKQSNDKGWQLPLWEEYQSAMDSNIADVCNTSSVSAAGTIAGACFLSRFTENYKWAHIDCAGTAWVSGKNKSATGRGVPLLVQFLQTEATKNG